MLELNLLKSSFVRIRRTDFKEKRDLKTKNK